MVTLKDSIYLQLNWQSALPMSWGDILLSLSTRGPKHSSLEGGQPPPNHSTRAEPCQNHARLMIQPRRAQASSQEYCPAHTLLLCPRNGRSTVALLAHLCPWHQAWLWGQKQFQGASPHLGEASLILFQNQDHYHHYPCPAHKWDMNVFKERKSW